MMNKLGKVAVLMGGSSAERPVSLESGQAVLSALLRQGVDASGIDHDGNTLYKLKDEKFDRVFIALHGRGGEDGQIQGALDALGIPYTGSGVLGSALAMDKWRTKMVWQSCGFAVPNYRILDETSNLDAVVEALGLPLIVKPANEGSTIGLTKVTTAEMMGSAYQMAAKHDCLVMAEEFIAGQELTASVLGDRALPLIRIVPASGLYDYEAKYLLDSTQYLCPCGLSREVESAIQTTALNAFDVLGCYGWGRLDFILDNSGTAYLLEANTVPGMTSHSLVPMAAKAAGVTFDELVLIILEQTIAQVSKPLKGTRL